MCEGGCPVPPSRDDPGVRDIYSYYATRPSKSCSDMIPVSTSSNRERLVILELIVISKELEGGTFKMPFGKI